MTTTTRLAMAAVVAMTMVACGGSPAPVVTGLEVTPRTVSLEQGTSGAVTVVATYDDGSTEDVTAKVTWHAVDSNVAGASQGLVEAYFAGATDLVASWNGHEATARVTVSPIITALFGLAPSPADPTVLVMMGLFSDGSLQPVALTITWTSTRSDVIAVSEAGALSPVGPGVATISATVAGQLFTLRVRVGQDLTITIGG